MAKCEYFIKKTVRSQNVYYKIIPASSHCAQKGLNIEIGSGLLHEYDFDDSESSYFSDGRLIYGVLGILHIYPISYLWVISELNEAKGLRVNGKQIFEVKKVELLSISGHKKAKNKPYEEGIKKLLSSGFYFSYDHDLTKRLQRDKGDDRYWWNRNMYEDFKTYGISSNWAIKLIQGYVGYSKIIVNSENLEITLISRRRTGMAGTRYSKRGIDDNGNTANFVETEQILKFEEYLMSFVQIRGSVPAFWEQTGISADLKLTRTKELDRQAFDKHFNDMVGEYGKIVWANLLNNKRSYEMKLIQRFEELVKMYSGSNNRYLYFNFHQECSKNNFKVMDEKLKLGSCSSYLGFWRAKNGMVQKKQIGVLRTNCLDCLDRTNICQAFYAFKAFVHQLDYFKKAGILNEDSVTQAQNNCASDGKFSVSPNLDNHTASQLINCMKAVRKMWAENGDEISRQYAGTGSTSTEVTVNGKTSIKGKISHKMTSIERFFKNNINSKDDKRQDSIDYLTGTHKNFKSVKGQEVESALQENEDEFSVVNTYTLCVFSWNIAGNEPKYEMDFVNVFKSDEFSSSPDIAVIGFQETLALNAINCLKGHDKGRVEALRSFAEDALDDVDPEAGYKFVAHSPMVGLLIMVFAKERLICRITKVSSTKVKSGFGGNVGNKGSVMVRFDLDNTSICLCCCHLESGQKKEKERRQNMKEIVESGFSEVSSKYNFLNHDVKIFFGDLNFRVNLGYEDVNGIIDNMNDANRDDQMHILLNNDQLNQCKMDYSWMYHYKEMPIKFLPTYKYDKKSMNYDTSKKQRVPAWTDRILWHHNEEENGGRGSKYISPILYERRESLFSDHRPVVAYFEIHAHRHCEDRKEKFKYSEASKKATSFIVKKPNYDPVETKVKKEFEDDFEIFGTPAKKKKEEHIHLELNIPSQKAQVREETKQAHSSPFEDLLEFDNNLIDIREKKDDGNLIDFSSSSRPMPQPGQRFYPHANSFHNPAPFMNRQMPVQAVHHGYSVQNHFPVHAPQPAGFFNTAAPSKGPRMRASVPRKPSADLIERAKPSNIPQKKVQRTEDFFNFS